MNSHSKKSAFRDDSLGSDDTVGLAKKIEKVDNLELFIKRKKTIAMLLLPVLIVLAIISLGKWIYVELFSIDQVYVSNESYGSAVKFRLSSAQAIVRADDTIFAVTFVGRKFTVIVAESVQDV